MTEKTFETKPLKGALFKVKEKKSENSPDFTGNIADDQGRQFRVSAWNQTSKSGTKYLSLTLTLDDGSNNYSKPAKAKQSEPAGIDDGLDDNIPF
jgi:hypothetical protein